MKPTHLLAPLLATTAQALPPGPLNTTHPVPTRLEVPVPESTGLRRLHNHTHAVRTRWINDTSFACHITTFSADMIAIGDTMFGIKANVPADTNLTLAADEFARVFGEECIGCKLYLNDGVDSATRGKGNGSVGVLNLSGSWAMKAFGVDWGNCYVGGGLK
ncbi:hypothetical protein KVT40_001562 [Elsinoe batatas]|uniref:Uncharacterized protein n=1 Tax=Elsinoe batatas TaxID=2601811 RepID=A0A8K0L895_9PEZI|nr:hypothetical protein KVT40_001562 [Elsinoe batatas]